MSLLTGILAYYKLDEDSGTTTADATGNGYTGTLTSSSIWTASGKINAGIAGNNSDYVNLGSSLETALPTSAISVSAWAKSPNGGIASCDVPFGSHEGWALFTSGTILCDIGNGSTTTRVSVTEPAGGNWYHVVFTYDGTTITVYTNGSSAGTGTLAGPIVYNTGLIPVIGYVENYGSPFNGSIDEVGIWTRALSSSEGTQLYNSGSGLQYPFGAVNSGSPRVLTLGWTPLFAAGAALIRNPKLSRRGLLLPCKRS